MSNDNINQVPAEWQAHYRRILIYIDQINSLVHKIKHDLTGITQNLPEKLKNEMLNLSLSLEAAHNNYSYAITKIEDVFIQQMNQSLTLT